jgi:NAD(P)-dependent dehydrogenase (short-subunit alcohol dehydrogenase family)
MGQQQLQELHGAAGSNGRVGDGAGGILIVDEPVGIGTGLQEQPAPLGVARADRRGERRLDGVGHVRHVGEKQAQAPVSVAGEPHHVQVMVIGYRAVHGTEDMPLEEWERILRVNLYGTFLCSRAAIPYLKKRAGAAIVNISSSSALVGGGGGAHYAASKAGVDGLTRHLARELAPYVRVNSIQPRTIDTDLFKARYAHAPQEQDRLRHQVPLGRFGQPADIADAVAFLASDWASYITGQLLLIDGGRTYQ